MQPDSEDYSIAFTAGMKARDCGTPLVNSAIRNLHPDSPQYSDYIAGWDKRDSELKADKQSD